MRKVSAIFLSLLFLLSAQVVLAQQNLNVTQTYPIKDTQAKTGDIITAKDGTYVLSTVTYDANIFGVLQDNPLLVFRKIDAAENEKAIVRQGDVQVNINTVTGDIKLGDRITSSPIAGQGMKAEVSGYVLGRATSNPTYTGTATFQGQQVKTGTVQVALQIEYAELNTARNTNRLFEQVNSAFFKNVQDPEKFTVVVRYIIAGIVSILFLMISFFGFTRSLSKSVEAIGRNPLAKSSIQFSMLIHLGLAIVTSIIGLIIAFVVIRV